jgi:hypothetical protein
MKRNRLGRILLGIWLIAGGLLPYLTITVPHREAVLSILAVASGILLILER